MVEATKKIDPEFWLGIFFAILDCKILEYGKDKDVDHFTCKGERSI